MTLTALLLAVFAVGALAVPPPAVEFTQSGSWQQAEFRTQNPAEDFAWQVDVIYGEAIISELQQSGMHILTLRAAPGQNAFVRVGSVYVWLLCDNELQTTLARANTIAQNPNGRYCTQYLAQLDAAIAATQLLYTTQEAITPYDLAAALEQLHLLLEQPVLLAGNGLLRRLAPAWWRMVDVVTTPFRALQNQSRASVLLPVVGRVFSAMFAL